MLTFETPKGDAPRNFRFKRDVDLDALIARPGEWAVIDKGPANRIRARAESWVNLRRPRLPDGCAFEVTHRRTRKDSRQSKLFMRYVGESEPGRHGLTLV